jgi:head-tail adaptor
MQAGQMRSRIVIQSPIMSQNPFQPPSGGTWSDVATVWAQIMSASSGKGAKVVAAAGVQTSQVSHVVSIRYPGTEFTVTGGYQVVYTFGGNSRYLSVLDGVVNVDERNRELLLLCYETNPVLGGAPA